MNAEMRKLPVCQAAVLLLLSSLSAFWGFSAALSAFLGGVSYLIPSVLAVAVMCRMQKHPESGFVGVFLAESLKVMSAVILMVLCFVFYPAMRHGFFLAGLLFTSSGILLLGK